MSTARRAAPPRAEILGCHGSFVLEGRRLYVGLAAAQLAGDVGLYLERGDVAFFYLINRIAARLFQRQLGQFLDNEIRQFVLKFHTLTIDIPGASNPSPTHLYKPMLRCF